MVETFKDIPTYEGKYQVSDLGTVRHINYDINGNIFYNILKQHDNSVSLVDFTNVVNVYPIRFLVACTFLNVDIAHKPRPRFRHLDGNLNNPSLYNIEIVSFQNLPDEHWKSIPGFEGIYQVSDKGRVKRCSYCEEYIRKDTNKVCKRYYDDHILKSSKGEYATVNLIHNEISEFVQVHRLVATMFLPNPENKPEVNHIDGNKWNNNVENLEWVTSKENIQHAWKTGLAKSENKPKFRGKEPVKCLETNEEFESILAASKHFNISEQYLGERIKQNKQCHGLTFVKLRQ